MSDESENDKPKLCEAQNTAGKPCKNKCVLGKKFCATTHGYLNDYTDDELAKTKKCCWCSKPKMLVEGKNICPECLPKQQAKNRRNNANRNANKDKCIAKTLDKDKNVIQCSHIMIDDRFCNRHIELLGKYTNEEIEKMEVVQCSGCHNNNYRKPEYKQCLNCNDRRNKATVNVKKAKKEFNSCVTCKKDGKNIIGKNKVGDEYYCGNHVKTAQTLSNGGKLCSKPKCPNPCAEGRSRCHKCLDNGKKTDKKRQENKSKHNTMIEKQYEDDEIDVLDNENADGYGQYPKIGLSTAKKNTLSLCQKNGCGIYFTPFLNSKKMLSVRCRGCLHEQRQTEANRPDRDRKEEYREYEKKPERQAARKEWRKDNPEKMKLYCDTYRLKELINNPEEYYIQCAKSKKQWMDTHPEYREADNIKRKLNPNYKLGTCKNVAYEKGYEFTISDEYAIELLINKKCHYCGGCTYNSLNGIDRIDSNKGYIDDNVVTACRMCNEMKNTLGYQQFINICEHIGTYNDMFKGKCHPESFANYPKKRYINDYVNSSNKRKIEFALSNDDFNQLIEQKCYICDKQNDNDNNNGIDRVDSSIGYIKDNCKGCCGTCNIMKKDYSLEYFILQCTIITLYQHNRHENNNLIAIDDHDSDDDIEIIDESDDENDQDNKPIIKKQTKEDKTKYQREYHKRRRETEIAATSYDEYKRKRADERTSRNHKKAEREGRDIKVYKKDKTEEEKKADNRSRQQKFQAKKNAGKPPKSAPMTTAERQRKRRAKLKTQKEQEDEDNQIRKPLKRNSNKKSSVEIESGQQEKKNTNKNGRIKKLEESVNDMKDIISKKNPKKKVRKRK
jgi:hypothetical protein